MEDNLINESRGNLSKDFFSRFVLFTTPMVPCGRMERLFHRRWRKKIVKAIKSYTIRDFPRALHSNLHNLCSHKKNFSRLIYEAKCLRNQTENYFRSRGVRKIFNCLRSHSPLRTHRSLILIFLTAPKHRAMPSSLSRLCFHLTRGCMKIMSETLTQKCIHHLELSINVVVKNLNVRFVWHDKKPWSYPNFNCPTRRSQCSSFIFPDNQNKP